MFQANVFDFDLAGHARLFQRALARHVRESLTISQSVPVRNTDFCRFCS
jgi:hypothetical protein